MGLDIKTLATSKKNIKESLEGAGAIKGKNATISSITPIDGGNCVTFSYTLDDGTVKTSTLNVMDGKDGADGVQGVQGLKGDKGDQGSQGVQGVQGIKGDKGDDGYPFLIYKEYSDLSEFNQDDFPEIGLMFIIKSDGASSFPVYRYIGDEEIPYSYITDLSSSEGIKGDKGDKGNTGLQGVAGKDGKDGTTYTPTIGTVTSIAPTQNATATVTVDETEKIATFSFGIPKGKDGEDGADGFTPTITENTSNKEDYYRLDIINKNERFTTPNLMGVIGTEYKNKSVGTPVGEIISYMGTIAPENYLICDGTVYQITDYPILAQHFIDNFGSVNYFGGNGTTTFAVPDLRGEFLRGTGTAIRDTGAGLAVGVHQDATRQIDLGYNPTESTFWLDGSAIPSSGSLSSVNADKKIRTVSSTGKYVSLANWSGSSGYTIFTARPTNTAVLYCIKYQPTYWIMPTNVIEEE